MRGKLQGKRSTKEKATIKEAAATKKSTKQINCGFFPQPDPIHVTLDKRKDIFTAVYKPQDTIYTDQTGKIPHPFSQGHNYQTVIHNIGGNSTWIEPMEKKSQGGNDKSTTQRPKSHESTGSRATLPNPRKQNF